MTIVTAKHADGRDLTQEEITKDSKKLIRIHKDAIKDQPTWQFFGGVIWVGDHEYQVVA